MRNNTLIFKGAARVFFASAEDHTCAL